MLWGARACFSFTWICLRSVSATFLRSSFFLSTSASRSCCSACWACWRSDCSFRSIDSDRSNASS